MLAAVATRQPLGGRGRKLLLLPFPPGSLRPVDAGFRFTHEKGRGSRACAAGAPEKKICYDILMVELPNLGVSLYGIPQFWQFLFVILFDDGGQKTSP